MTNTLYHGDNLDIMLSMPAESVDLIYLDPPFFSNRNYEVIWGDRGEVRSFQDRWSGGIEHYIAWLYERVEQMHRLLKPTGSIFLHCDWHAQAEIKVWILNKLFGRANCRNEIIWCYNGPANVSKAFPHKHDTIFRYSKTDDFIFNKANVLIDYEDATLKRRMYAETKKKGIRFKGKAQDEYLKGRVPFDWWSDIHSGGQMSAHERIGYPTQKPEALVERIIQCATSGKDDVVLDPFMGGGTTVAVADKLGRQWIGIDQSVQAVKVAEMRVKRAQDLLSVPFVTRLHKYDYDTIRHSDAFQFEAWVIGQYGGTPHNRKGGDSGVDGKMPDGTPVQVKRSDNIGVNTVKNFYVSAEQYNARLFEHNRAAGKPCGHIIAFSFGKGAVQEAARLKNEKGVVIELITVESFVPMASKPRITFEIQDIGRDSNGAHEVELTAAAAGEQSGIEFYAWDFAYNAAAGFNPSVLRDTRGTQRITLPAGDHCIAVKVVDTDGLESIESRTWHLNGSLTEVQ